jgi:hypothetical protein
MKTAALKKVLIVGILVGTLLAVGCKKNSYFKDTGINKPDFSGTVLDYLQSKPAYFDSIVKIIHLASLDEVFAKEKITFFAPSDSSVRMTIDALNLSLRSQGEKEVTRLEQIKPEVWRAQLTRYLFKGEKSMNDYPQLDNSNLSAFPGQIYAAYDGQLMNVGVIYNDAGGVKYAGYRQLTISYIPSATSPRDFQTWFSATVASVNIHPTNGYVHVLEYPTHFFGFDPSQFIENAIAAGID